MIFCTFKARSTSAGESCDTATFLTKAPGQAVESSHFIGYIDRIYPVLSALFDNALHD
jgi:hypothetical protein